MGQELEQQLRLYIDQQRGLASVGSSLRGWLEGGSDFRERQQRLLTWLATAGASHPKEDGVFLSSGEIASFTAKLGALGSVGSVLDPVCGAGLLLATVAEATGATIVHGVDINREVCDLARLVLPPTSQVFLGDTLDATVPMADEYDLIVGEPPFGMRMPESYTPEHDKRSYPIFSDAFLCWSASKLSQAGTAIFLIPSSCFGVRANNVWSYLNRQGIYRRAMIHVPSGQLKATFASCYIVILDRQRRESMFVAQFTSDVEHQRVIIENLKLHRPGKRASQGRLVDPEGFQGFVALDAKERLEAMAKRRGLSPTSIRDLVVGQTVMRRGSDIHFVDSSNDVYFNPLGRCHVVIKPEELNPNALETVQLRLNSNLVDARFFATSLNDEMGQLFLEGVRLPSSTIGRIDVSALLDGTYYLPSLTVQHESLKVLSLVNALRAELDEIDSAVRTTPQNSGRALQQLRKVNHEDTFENWLEGLPFPLASILWRFRASSASTKEKNEILLHFFEALAEFWATIYLSAAKADQEFWADNASGLSAALEGGRLSFDRATFGLWKCVVEFFRAKFEKLQNSDSERCRSMFRTGSPEVLEMLFDRRMLTVLQNANSVRNDHAHGGVAGVRDIESAHSQLTDLVQTCRSVMGTAWKRYELVQPSGCRFVGGLFVNQLRHVMGTRTPFATVERTTTVGMEDGQLHLLDPDDERALKLLAFVRVMPSPKTESNACYFYNRRQTDNQRFVSYHFDADSEVEEFFADTQAALDGLRPFGPMTSG